jgi:hypothetical protein
MKWSGNQDAQGFQLSNYRDETLDVLPAYVVGDDSGRKIFVGDIASPDYGPWIGDDPSGGWQRPGFYGGGGGGGYLEPSLMCVVEPHIFFPGSTGFSPVDPAFVTTSRILDVDESVILKVGVEDAKKKKGSVLCPLIATIDFAFPYCDAGGPGEEWWTHVLYFSIPPGYTLVDNAGIGMFMAKIAVWNDALGGWVDSMSIRVNNFMP